MINKTFFSKLKKDFEFYEKHRRIVIGSSNNALQKSKQAIFSLHRNDDKEADRLLKIVEKIFKDLEKIFNKKEFLRYEGAYKASTEEYVEAKLFYKYLKTGKISEIQEVKVGFNSYIGGLSDLTGELSRKAIFFATKGNFKEVEKIKNTIDDIIKELIKLNLTGYLRTKYDQTKNNMRKMESVMYDIKIRRR